MVKKKGIGISVEAPQEACDDANCPFHGRITVRGRMFNGYVEKAKMAKTATVMWERVKPIPKYERSERRRTKIHAHNPPCINAQPGDMVTVVETRPLSKTKSFVIVAKRGKDVVMQLKEMAREESQKELAKKQRKPKESPDAKSKKDSEKETVKEDEGSKVKGQ